MIYLHQIYKVSQRLELQIEEIVFLYTIYCRTNNPEDTELSDYFSWYLKRFKYYNRNGEKSIPIQWYDMIEKLEEENFIEVYFTQEEREKKKISIDKIRLTNKFKDSFMTDDVDTWWNHFVDLFKEYAAKSDKGMLVVIGTSTPILLPEKGDARVNSLEAMKKYFWNYHCGGGDRFKIGKFLEDTESYLKDVGANVKVSNYLVNYDSIMSSKK